jgi:hypothetical protein
MFLRWKKSKLGDDTTMTAVLVESYRIDGKPRQRVVKYLATIPKSKISVGGWWYGFWGKVILRLNELELSSDSELR